MKKKIVATNKSSLEKLIQQEIYLNGACCDLNHIDVSKVTNMSWLFCHSAFNGDISKWDVSNVIDMNNMFYGTLFNGDISRWDTTNTTNMSWMFAASCFNQDISLWNVSNVTTMEQMFFNSKFNQNLVHWQPIKLTNKKSIFSKTNLEKEYNLPYWATIEIEFLEQVINAHRLHMTLEETLICLPKANTTTTKTKKI